MRVRRFTAAVGTAVLVAAGLVAVAGSPAGAITVSTEAELQTAFADVNETEVVLANDIDLTCVGGGDLDRTSATALTLDGAGFTITQTCDDERVVHSLGTGMLTVTNVTITGGEAIGGQGGGGIASTGPLVVLSALITDNEANTAQGGGGINGDTVTIYDSTIAGNSADDFGGGMNVGDAFIVRSTISGNVSANRAGGISANEVTLVNSTVTGNFANGAVEGFNGQGGGIYVNVVNLVYSTVAANTSAGSANILVDDGLTSFASVIALPLGGGPNCSGEPTVSTGYSFSDDASCGLTGPGDRQSAGNPQLGTLGNNGGPTQTLLPAATSPLVDGVPLDLCRAEPAADVTTDQRGVTRPQGAGCDIGSVELEVTAPIPLTPTFTG